MVKAARDEVIKLDWLKNKSNLQYAAAVITQFKAKLQIFALDFDQVNGIIFFGDKLSKKDARSLQSMLLWMCFLQQEKGSTIFFSINLSFIDSSMEKSVIKSH